MTRTDKFILLAGNTEFKRYFWAGSLTFAADFTVLFLLTEFAGINYLWSNLASVSLGIIVSYLLCIKWVFAHRKYSQVVFEFPVFVVTCIAGLIINEVCMWGLVEFVEIHYLISKIVVTLFVFVVNFCLKKLLLFNVPGQKKDCK